MWWLTVLFFFFSSRRRHTRCSRDWSSDVCSSDLGAFVRDLTEEKRAEQVLQKEVGEREAAERLLRQVIDADPSLVFVKDRDGKFVLVNKAVADIYGTTAEAQVGKTDADFNPNKAEG